jgi:hypothetical protein
VLVVVVLVVVVELVDVAVPVALPVASASSPRGLVADGDRGRRLHDAFGEDLRSDAELRIGDQQHDAGVRGHLR